MRQHGEGVFLSFFVLRMFTLMIQCIKEKKTLLLLLRRNTTLKQVYAVCVWASAFLNVRVVLGNLLLFRIFLFYLFCVIFLPTCMTEVLKMTNQFDKNGVKVVWKWTSFFIFCESWVEPRIIFWVHFTLYIHYFCLGNWNKDDWHKPER